MGAGRVLAVLGGLVAAAVAAGVWLVLGEPGPADETAPLPVETGAAGPARTDPAAGPRKPGRKHAKTAGNCELFGVVKRRVQQATAVGQPAAEQPAAGQEVQLVQEGVEPWSAVADDTGAFRLTAVPDGGPYELRIECKGFATIRLPGIALTRGESRDLGTLWLDQAVKVTVVVRTWSDTPVDGADVEAFAAPDNERGNFDWSKAWAQLAAAPVAVARATTDSEGRAVFPEMASGVWTFTARKAGLGKDGRSNVRIAGGGDVPPDVKIYLAQGHTLTGRVLDGDKKPVAKALLLAGRSTNVWDLGAAPTRARSVSGDDGKFELTDLPTGDVALLVARPGGIPFQAAIVRVPSVSNYDVVLRDGGRLEGTVTESGTGKPVEGATVRAYAWGGSTNRQVEATTDAQGKYAIAAVPEGFINDVQCTKDGWLQDRTDDSPMGRQFQIPAGDRLVRDLKMRQGAGITGVVTGPDGPVAGARVQAFIGSSDRGVAQTPTVVTDATGRYEIKPVERGRGIVRAWKEGLVQTSAPENVWMMVQQGNVPPQLLVEVPESGAATRDVTLERGAHIEGKVESPDGPVAGAAVTLWTNSGSSSKATTGPDGTFAIDGATPGSKANFGVMREGFVQTRSDPVDVLQDQPTTGVVLKMAKVKLVRGKATSTTGQPLRDGQVFVTLKQQANRGNEYFEGMNYYPQQVWGGQQGGAVPVRPDGSFEATIPFAEGSFAVRATALDHATGESAAQQLVETRTEYEANVVIEPGYAIRGRVASKGVALPGADVTLGGGGGRGQMMEEWGGGGNAGSVVAVTDAQGSFTIDHLATGKYVVTANADSYVRKSVPDVAVPTTGDVAIDLEQALEITGKVTFQDGKPAPGAIVVAQRDDPNQKINRFRGGMGWGGGGAQSIAASDGGFRIRGLASGNYKLTVTPPWDGSVNLKSRTTDPVAAGTADYRLTVDAGGSITGRVLDPAKKPVAGAQVNANPVKQDGGNQWRMAKTKADGSFELSGLGDGPFGLYAAPPQFGDSARLLPANAQNVSVGTRDLELVLDAGISIDGIVLDAAGKPLTDAMLNLQPKPNAQGQQPNINWYNSNSTTGPDGRFRFQGLSPGQYGIMLSTWQGTRFDGMVLLGGGEVAGGATDVTLTAVPGDKIAGTVVDEAGLGIAGAWINANAPSGVSRGARTGADGRFEVTGLPRGTVNLHVNAQKRPPLNVQNVDTNNLGLRLVMPKGATLLARIVDSAGVVYAGQNVVLRKTDGGDHSSWAQTDKDGNLKAENVPEGTYEVSVHRKKGENAWEQVKVGSAKTGEATVELRIP